MSVNLCPLTLCLHAFMKTATEECEKKSVRKIWLIKHLLVNIETNKNNDTYDCIP